MFVDKGEMDLKETRLSFSGSLPDVSMSSALGLIRFSVVPNLVY